jgi:tRNA threonylcarbamoyl adenosine modification protein (Sua5/YciO/YrdC/YwlC family)
MAGTPDSRATISRRACGTKGANTLSAERLKVSADSPEASAVRYAVEFITRGRVVGIPTDTFYGLAADPFNLAAVDEIYRVKGRPETRALPILVNSIDQAITLARDVSPSFLKLAQRFWPGALTLLIEASRRIPLKVTANTGRVAMRWPHSAVACKVIELLDAPITGTSANISGFPPCSNADSLVKQLGDRLPLVLDAGETGASLASTIVEVDGDDWRILREGIVTEADIKNTLA